MPGQLERLLRLMGAGSVLVPADGAPGAKRRPRAGARRARAARRAVVAAPGRELRRPLTAARPGATAGAATALELPALRRFQIAGSRGRGARAPARWSDRPRGRRPRRSPRWRRTAHSRRARSATRATSSPTELREELERGGTLVLTDSNRRRVVNSARLRLRYGPTLGPEDDISPDSPTFELFDQRVERPAHARALQRPARARIADPAGPGDLPRAPRLRGGGRRPRHLVARGQEPRRRPALDRAALPRPLRARIAAALPARRRARGRRSR